LFPPSLRKDIISEKQKTAKIDYIFHRLNLKPSAESATPSEISFNRFSACKRVGAINTRSTLQ
jgi:hypothetical protein